MPLLLLGDFFRTGRHEARVAYELELALFDALAFGSILLERGKWEETAMAAMYSPKVSAMPP